jgi:hypothetical protein
LIYKKRVRIEKDIYFKSIAFSYLCLVASLLLGVVYIVNPNEALLLSIAWLGFAGFIAYVIIGHLYKIVPFLVWFERFSPYVGKKKVPMLSDMIPVQSANIQLLLSTIGIVIIAVALFVQSDIVYKSGVSFLFVGSIFLIKDIFYMINFKGDENV